MGPARPPREAPYDRLLKRAEFVAAAKGQRARTPLFTLQSLRRSDSADAPPRLGLTVTRKEGAAAERNRMRRRLREALRQIAPVAARPGHDYVVVARRPLLDAPFETLLADLNSAFRRVHRTRPDGAGA